MSRPQVKNLEPKIVHVKNVRHVKKMVHSRKWFTLVDVPTTSGIGSSMSSSQFKLLPPSWLKLLPPIYFRKLKTVTIYVNIIYVYIICEVLLMIWSSHHLFLIFKCLKKTLRYPLIIIIIPGLTSLKFDINDWYA